MVRNPGMKWFQLFPTVNGLVQCRGTIPSVLVIHCGGNDIGQTPNGALLFHLKFAIKMLSHMLPGTYIVWSSILPRWNWRFSDNMQAMEITRKRINRGMRSLLLKVGVRNQTSRFQR